MSETIYTHIDESELNATIHRLMLRIKERFPERNLAEICGALGNLCKQARIDTIELTRPNWLLRIAITIIICALLLIFTQVGKFITFSPLSTNATDLVRTLETFINMAVFGGLGLMFLISLERRLDRRKVLKSLHKVRSIIHVIDMHQLTKDPSTLAPIGDLKTSPKRTLNAYNLARYLEYCSEMLSLSGKVTALYAQHMDDDVIVAAVNDIEMLASNLSSRIWQKINMAERMAGMY